MVFLGESILDTQYDPSSPLEVHGQEFKVRPVNMTVFSSAPL